MKIFLSTPISCFDNKTEFEKCKSDILKLTKSLKSKNHIFSEIEKINNESEYDSPDKSLSDDFSYIKECDAFILYYPKKIATSALIELGFAIAFNKRIIIITPQKSTLPYLVHGISAINKNSKILESENINDELTQNIIDYLSIIN